MNVGVLASGAGSNLQALLDLVHGRDGIRISAVASDRPQAPALERARQAGVEALSFPRVDFADRVLRDEAIAHWLHELEVELVVLAGYMQLLSPAFLSAFPAGVINVHPALLPAFPGLNAVQQALDYDVKVFGVTVHYVDEGIDTGPVILQRSIELAVPGDAAAVLERLRPLEHELLPEAVQLIARGAVHRDPPGSRRIRVER